GRCFRARHWPSVERGRGSRPAARASRTPRARSAKGRGTRQGSASTGPRPGRVADRGRRLAAGLAPSFSPLHSMRALVCRMCAPLAQEPPHEERVEAVRALLATLARLRVRLDVRSGLCERVRHAHRIAEHVLPSQALRLAQALPAPLYELYDLA